MSVAIAGVVGGCGLLPEPRAAAPSLRTSLDADGATFTLDPWPYAAWDAFLCLHRPAHEITASHPDPDAAAQCQPLDTTKVNGGLSARFSVDHIERALREPFATSRSPWFLAVTGQNGTSSDSFVMVIETSPIPSDAGPS